MDIISIIISMADVIFVGLGAYATMHSTFHTEQKWKNFKSLVDNTKIPKTKNIYRDTVKLLSMYEEYLPVIKEKIKKKFIFVLLFIVFSGSFISINIPSDGQFILNDIIGDNVEIIDILILLLQILIILINKNFLVEKQDREFLLVYHFLIDEFYRKYVDEKIIPLNKKIRKMYGKRIESNMDDFRNNIREALTQARQLNGNPKTEN